MVLITLVIVAIVGGGAAFMQQPKFGKLPIGKRQEKIQNSPNFKNGQFQNLENTPDLAEGSS